MTAAQPVAPEPVAQEPAAAPVEDAAHPALSVVVPTRGRPELVRLAVQGVVDQDYAGPIECLVVHDQEAPDHALERLGHPGRTVRVLRNEGDPGLAGSRNAGLALVRTELVASCDDDDTWQPDKVRRQVERLRADPQMLVVGAGIRLLMPRGQGRRVARSCATRWCWPTSSRSRQARSCTPRPC